MFSKMSITRIFADAVHREFQNFSNIVSALHWSVTVSQLCSHI